MDIKEVLPLFAELMRERLAAGVFTTEDSVRYTFFCAYLRLGGDHVRLIQEHPHPAQGSAREIDTVVRGDFDRNVAALEFKYTRIKKATQNGPQRAGKLLNDMTKLAILPRDFCAAGYVVLLSDMTFVRYLDRSRTRLCHLWRSRPGSAVAVDRSDMQSMCRSVRDQVHTPCDLHVETLFASDLPAGHHLRVWRVGTAT